MDTTSLSGEHMWGNLKEWETISRNANFGDHLSSTEKVKYTLSLSKKGELDWMTLIEVLQNRYFVCVGGFGGSRAHKSRFSGKDFQWRHRTDQKLPHWSWLMMHKRVPRWEGFTFESDLDVKQVLAAARALIHLMHLITWWLQSHVCTITYWWHIAHFCSHFFQGKLYFPREHVKLLFYSIICWWWDVREKNQHQQL